MATVILNILKYLFYAEFCQNGTRFEGIFECFENGGVEDAKNWADFFFTKQSGLEIRVIK